MRPGNCPLGGIEYDEMLVSTATELPTVSSAAGNICKGVPLPSNSVPCQRKGKGSLMLSEGHSFFWRVLNFAEKVAEHPRSG